MTRRWTDIQSIEHIILQMRETGQTRREIAEALKLDIIQIKNCIWRFNRKQAKPSAPSKRKGRSRKHPASSRSAGADHATASAPKYQNR